MSPEQQAERIVWMGTTYSGETALVFRTSPGPGDELRVPLRSPYREEVLAGIRGQIAAAIRQAVAQAGAVPAQDLLRRLVRGVECEDMDELYAVVAEAPAAPPAEILERGRLRPRR
jgi:hypothetical protein